VEGVVVNGFAVVLVLALGSGSPQQPPPEGTRAAELHALREAKSRELKPPERNGVDRLLFKIEDSLIVERWLNPPRGLYLRLGGIAEGSGFGAGPGYRYSTGAFDFRVSAAASLRRYTIAEASLLLPGAVKDGPFVELSVRRRDFPQEDFFGLGPDSLVDERTDFALRDTLARAAIGARKGRFSAGVSGGYLDPSIGAGTDKRMPSTEEVFGFRGVPGLLQQTTFTLVEPFLEFSTADPPLNPVSGVSLRSSFSRYSDRDADRYSFRRVDVDARAYIPFFQRTHTIALRTWIAEARPQSGHEVPFYLQPTLGGSYSLRGFRTFRFRDQSVALVQAEYRWRINELVSGALFYDTGAVAARLGDLGTLERDYGFGIRAGGRGGVAFRADVALGSGEGTRILLRFNNVF
jgi:hypothetical protein